VCAGGESVGDRVVYVRRADRVNQCAVRQRAVGPEWRLHPDERLAELSVRRRQHIVSFDDRFGYRFLDGIGDWCESVRNGNVGRGSYGREHV
jgi:hypothetical protein